MKNGALQFAPHVKWRGEKFGAVIFDTLNEKVYVTNATGRDILSLLEQGLAAGPLAERLPAEFAGDAAQIKSEAVAFLRGLQAAGLVTSPGEDKT